MTVWKWIHKKCHKSPNFGTNLPSLNGHNSDPRGPIDLNSFLMVRPLQGLGDGCRNCPKNPFLTFKVVTRNGTFEPFFTKWHHYFGFHCFCFYYKDFGRFLLNFAQWAWGYKQALRRGLRSCSVYRAYNVKICQNLSKFVKSCHKLS